MTDPHDYDGFAGGPVGDEAAPWAAIIVLGGFVVGILVGVLL